MSMYSVGLTAAPLRRQRPRRRIRFRNRYSRPTDAELVTCRTVSQVYLKLGLIAFLVIRRFR